jgi:hypothetical protein
MIFSDPQCGRVRFARARQHWQFAISARNEFEAPVSKRPGEVAGRREVIAQPRG